MIKKILSSAAMLACTMTANAAEQQFAWSFTGLEETYSSDSSDESVSFLPNATFSGHFSADDVNHDGIFTKPEIRTFEVNGDDLLHCSGSRSCSLSTFSYAPGGLLNFDASFYANRNPEWGVNLLSTIYYSSPTGYSTSGLYDYQFSVYRDYKITDQTVFSITNITPVPEPESWLLLGAGLALVATARRRQSRAS